MPTSLEGLNPYVKEKAEQLLVNANKRLKKYKMIITQAYRSKEEQNELYAKGRTQAQLDKAGIKGVKPQPKEQVVTNAKGGTSMHNFGLAIDFALVDPTGKKCVWDTKTDFDKDGQADWLEVVAEAKKLGFEWGGDWTNFKDYPHFQMTGGLTDKEVIAGKKPVFKKETAPVSTHIGVAKVQAEKLNIRLTASGESEVVGTLKEGQVCKVYAEQDGWLKIAQGKWISKKYVVYHVV